MNEQKQDMQQAPARQPNSMGTGQGNERIHAARGRVPTTARRMPFSLYLFLGLMVAGFLLLAGCAAPPSSTNNSIAPLWGGLGSGGYWGSFIGLFFVALAAGPTLVALAWMYGSLFSDERLRAWSKKELVECLYTAAIFVVATGLVLNLSSFMVMLPAMSVWGGSAAPAWGQYVQWRCNQPAPTLDANGVNISGLDRPCHIRLAQDYLQVLFGATQSQAEAILRYYAPLSAVSTLDITVGGMSDEVGQFTIAPLGGLSQPLETLSGLFDIAVKNMISLRGQEYILDFLHVAFFPLFLAMGLFLRALYFTRRLGGLLIALALCFYIIYPLVFVFFHSLLFTMVIDSGHGWPTTPGATGQFESAMQVGQGIYPIEVVGGEKLGLVPPDQNAKDYVQSNTCGTYNAGPTDECNAGKVSTDGTSSTLMQCPPKDAAGNVIPATAGNLVCNTNNCQCQSSSFTYAHTGDFTADYTHIDPVTHQVVLNRGPNVVQIFGQNIDGMNDQQKTDAVNNFEWLADNSAKGWWQIVKEGFGQIFGGKAIVKTGGIVFATDDLLGFGGFIDKMAILLLFSLIAPFIAIMVSLAAVKAVSPMLGGDVEIAGLTRLI